MLHVRADPGSLASTRWSSARRSSASSMRKATAHCGRAGTLRLCRRHHPSAPTITTTPTAKNALPAADLVKSHQIANMSRKTCTTRRGHGDRNMSPVYGRGTEASIRAGWSGQEAVCCAPGSGLGDSEALRRARRGRLSRFAVVAAALPWGRG
jgi:hypothetical protein